MWLSERIHGDGDKADTKAVSTDSNENDDSRVDDDEDENEDLVKEFENGESFGCFLICCTYRICCLTMYLLVRSNFWNFDPSEIVTGNSSFFCIVVKWYVFSVYDITYAQPTL